jgi:hypothetical protein
VPVASAGCGRAYDPRVTTPAILFGAFDRHNLGDLLLAHVSAALLRGTPLSFAGLATRDLRGAAGHAVTALADLARQRGGVPAALIHVGGELLTCDAWQAAVMLQPPEQAQQVIAYFEARPQEQLAWVRRTLATAARAPYAAPREWIPPGWRVVYHAVGGVDLAASGPALRAEVAEKLRAADLVSVRDPLTLAALDVGVAARLVPDPAILVAALFGDDVRRRASQGEVAAIRSAFPQGFVAMQFGADLGDDGTLAELAAQIDEIAAATRCGVVCFCAGIAPWHDDPQLHRRLAARLRTSAFRRFASPDVWDLCALIASSRAYAGSSLHGRIVAMAFGVPRVNLPGRKQAAVAAAWEPQGVPIAVPVHGLAEGVGRALAVDAALLQDTAARLVRQALESFEPVQALLGLSPTPLKKV